MVGRTNPFRPHGQRNGGVEVKEHWTTDNLIPGVWYWFRTPSGEREIHYAFDKYEASGLTQYWPRLVAQGWLRSVKPIRLPPLHARDKKGTGT